MDLGLSGRVFLVTGGSRGLGRATATSLVAEGARVVLSGRNEEAVVRAAAALGTDRALGLSVDNDHPGTAERLIATAVAKFGRLDGALLSTGGPPAGTVASLTDDQWRAAFEGLFLGTVRLARAVADYCTTDGSLALVLSTSVSAPISGLSLSNGLRPGLAALVKDMAEEFGPDGVRVNGLLPGRIETERTRELDAKADRASTMRRTLSSIPLARYGQPEEFGRVAAFVLSPAASYVNGALIAIDGGSTRAL
jgi:3-oxoacyl-[acyl-carrier protein] reductase